MTSADDFPTFTAHLIQPGEARGGDPATLVAPDTKVVLNWNGPQGQHTLYSDQAPQGQPVELPYITAPLARDSTFVLRTVLGAETRHDCVTVTVDRPTLPGLLLDELAGGAELALPVGVVAAGAVVLGAATLPGCTVSGVVTATGPADVGDMTLAADVTGRDADAKLVTGDLTVSGKTLTELSLAVAGGPVSVLRAPSFHDSVPDLPPTDGFILAANQASGVKFTIGDSASSTTATDSRNATLPFEGGDELTGVTPQNAGWYVIRFGPEGTANAAP